MAKVVKLSRKERALSLINALSGITEITYNLMEAEYGDKWTSSWRGKVKKQQLQPIDAIENGIMCHVANTLKSLTKDVKIILSLAGDE